MHTAHYKCSKARYLSIAQTYPELPSCFHFVDLPFALPRRESWTNCGFANPSSPIWLKIIKNVRWDFHLNMFPLRKNYVRNLIKEVGFQRITTYGDFQETYREIEPDFFIHVAEKKYIEGDNTDE